MRDEKVQAAFDAWRHNREVEREIRRETYGEAGEREGSLTIIVLNCILDELDRLSRIADSPMIDSLGHELDRLNREMGFMGQRMENRLEDHRELQLRVAKIEAWIKDHEAFENQYPATRTPMVATKKPEHDIDAQLDELYNTSPSFRGRKCGECAWQTPDEKLREGMTDPGFCRKFMREAQDKDPACPEIVER